MTFGRSDVYETLRSATILGREVPFVMPWGAGRVMEGVIDLIYRLDDRLCIADYKTDLVTREKAPARAEQYRPQLSCYKTAVMHGLSVPSVSSQVIFLRSGLVITFEGG